MIECDLGTAAGADLDAFAAQMGHHPRVAGETDADFQARLMPPMPFSQFTVAAAVAVPQAENLMKRALGAPEKFISPHAPPEGEARELLVVLVEECAEAIAELTDVQQRATKALRFGLAEMQPGQVFTNAERLAHEIGDVEIMVARLVRAGVLDPAAIAVGRERKRRQLAKYMQCQSPPAPTDSVAADAPGSNENQ